MDTGPALARQDTEAQTRKLLEDYAAARIAMDYRKVAALLHPNARYIMPTNSQTAHLSGECRGREMICELMRQSDAIIEFYNSRIYDPIVSGNRAAVRWEMMQRNRGTGDALPVAGCAIVTQQDGLIVEYVHYCDTASIEALAGR